MYDQSSHHSSSQCRRAGSSVRFCSLCCNSRAYSLLANWSTALTASAYSPSLHAMGLRDSLSLAKVSASAGTGKRGSVDWAAKVGPGSGGGASCFHCGGRVGAKARLDIERDDDQEMRGSLEENMAKEEEERVNLAYVVCLFTPDSAKSSHSSPARLHVNTGPRPQILRLRIMFTRRFVMYSLTSRQPVKSKVQHALQLSVRSSSK